MPCMNPWCTISLTAMVGCLLYPVMLHVPASDFEEVKKLRGIVFRGVEHARQEGTVQTSTDASVRVTVPSALHAVLQRQFLLDSVTHDCHVYTPEDVFLASRVSFHAPDGFTDPNRGLQVVFYCSHGVC